MAEVYQYLPNGRELNQMLFWMRLSGMDLCIYLLFIENMNISEFAY